MTAPLAPPPPWPAIVILPGMLAVAVAIPFARRHDWVGWIASSTVAVVAVGIWVLLIWGLTRATIRWWRNPSASD